MGCLEDIQRVWPVAYARCVEDRLENVVPLSKHLALTACIQQCIARRRFMLHGDGLRVILRRGFERLVEELGEEKVEELPYVAGLLHDLGKASVYYLRRLREESRFPGHEHVVALLLEYAALREEREGYVAMYDLLAKTISRHHAAMERRHPNRFFLSSKSSSYVDRILYGMYQYISFIDNLVRYCRGKDTLCYHILNNISTSLNDIVEMKSRGTSLNILSFSNPLRSFKLSGIAGVSEPAVYTLTTVLTGTLIVADNISAEFCEERGSDDGASSTYVTYWKWELGLRGDEGFKNLLRNCLNSCIPELPDECTYLKRHT